MDVPSAGLSQTRVFSALGHGGGSWSPRVSDAWTYPAGDPWSYLASDPELSNVSSPESVSPSSSSSSSSSSSCSFTDFLPLASALASAAHVEPGETSSPSPPSSSSSSSSSLSGQGRRRLRSRNPSRQRQCASEKEKLRMRDLTKAVHRLRTYLPPSVAPEGQALTKIQTLRLAVRYIAHLSAQLDMPRPRGEQVSPPQARCPGREGGKITGQHWGTFTHPSRWTEAKLELWQRDLEQPTDHGAQNSTLNPTYEDLLKSTYNSTCEDLLKSTYNSTCEDLLKSTYNSTCEDLLNSSNDSLLQSPQYMEATESRLSYQEYGRDTIFHSVTPEYWV